MTKRQFIDLIQHSLTGGKMTPDLQAKYHPEIIGLHIGNIYSKILFEYFDKKSDKNIDVFTKTYNRSVSYDESLEVYYTNLPVKPLGLSTESVRSIRPNADTNNFRLYEFKKIDDKRKAIYSESLVGELNIGNIIWYSYNNTRVEYKYFKDGITEVQIRMVPDFASLDDDDNFNVPGNFYEEILVQIRQVLSGMRIDPTNDNNEKQV